MQIPRKKGIEYLFGSQRNREEEIRRKFEHTIQGAINTHEEQRLRTTHYKRQDLKNHLLSRITAGTLPTLCIRAE